MTSFIIHTILLFLLLLTPSAGAFKNVTASISNISYSPNPIEIDRFPFDITVSFTATVTAVTDLTKRAPHEALPRSSLPNYLDMIVEVCPPHPYESHCFVFPAGHLNRSTTGTFHAEAKIATDNAWWSDHPPSDMTAGIYTTDIAICDGNCVKWLTKPIVLAEIYSRFVIVQNEWMKGIIRCILLLL